MTQRAQEAAFYAELQELILAAEAGTLSEPQAARLEHLVCTDPTARRLYCQHVLETAQLRSWAAGGSTDLSDRLDLPIEPSPSGTGFFPALWGSLSSSFDFRTHPIRFVLLVTAIVACGVGIVTAMVHSARVQPMVQHAAKPAPEPVPLPRAKLPGPVALLRQYDATVWADGAEGMPSFGRGYFLGDTLDLREGLARFEFSGGAQIVIEGPCQITFEGPGAARLERGKLAALVEKQSAQGFTINTPFATVTDLGTEFGVAVCDEAADVAVYQGAVVMEVATSDGDRRAVRLGAGGTAKADREGNLTTGQAGSEGPNIVRSIHRRSSDGTIRFQEGVSPYSSYRTEATYIRSGHASRNFNTADQIIVGTTAPRESGDVLRSLLAFDVSAIPASDRIDSVSLRLTTYREAGLDQGGEPGEPTFDVYSYGFNFVQTNATWNAPAAGDATAGGTLGTRLASARFDPTQTGRTVTFADTAAFRAAVAGAVAGDGFLRLVVAKRDETTVGAHEFARFAGNWFATAAHRPELVVTHSAAPEPSADAQGAGGREPAAPGPGQGKEPSP